MFFYTTEFYIVDKTTKEQIRMKKAAAFLFYPSIPALLNACCIMIALIFAGVSYSYTYPYDLFCQHLFN